MKRMACTYLLLLAAALPASAQFEVSPDHYVDDREQVKAAISPADRLREEIAQKQAEIQASKAMLASRRDQLEVLRQEAITAGMASDGGSGVVYEYLAAEHEFSVQSTTLAARLQSDETALSSMRTELAALSAPQKFGPAPVASGSSHGRTKGEVILASR